MRLATVTAALAAALLVPAAAAAKEVSSVTVCGLSACDRVSKHDLAGSGSDLHVFTDGGDIAAAPTRRAPHYMVRIAFKEPGGPTHQVRAHWVPALELIRGDDGTWMHMPESGREALASVTAKMTPRPASKMPMSASSQSVEAADPATDNVVEVFSPAEKLTVAGDGGTTWPWIALPALAALAALASVRLLRTPRGARP